MSAATPPNAWALGTHGAPSHQHVSPAQGNISLKELKGCSSAASEGEQFSPAGFSAPSPPSAPASPSLQFRELRDSSPAINTRHTARGRVSQNLSHIPQHVVSPVGSAFTSAEVEPPAVGQCPSSPPWPAWRGGTGTEVMTWVWLQRDGSGIL